VPVVTGDLKTEEGVREPLRQLVCLCAKPGTSRLAIKAAENTNTVAFDVSVSTVLDGAPVMEIDGRTA
jgi:hypothetical protein